MTTEPDHPITPPADRRCESCGEPIGPRYRQRRYCSVCQILRDMAYREWVRKCEGCDTTFYPLRANWKLCPSCSVFDINPDRHEPCLLCKLRRRTAPGVRKTCIFCVQADPKIRREYLKVLRKVVADRRANGVVDELV